MSGFRQIIRISACLALLTGVASLALGRNGQDTGARVLPRVTFSLPPGLDSKAVRISYFMTGDFGGYGGFIQTEKDRLTYDMIAAFDGKPAIHIKIIAYLPGCEIVTLDTSVASVSQPLELPCNALGTIAMHGQISPASIKPAQPALVEITYVALWSHQFFGIADGPIVTIPVGTAMPDSEGRFEVQLPDYARQSGLGDGVFQFVLRQGSDRETSITLSPALEVGKMDGLKVCSSYPFLIQFLAENH